MKTKERNLKKKTRIYKHLTFYHNKLCKYLVTQTSESILDNKSE